ncbi:hypothetical protein BAUCODRAFT_47978, partial [Baudoinia panamericana UAMH 10762]
SCAICGAPPYPECPHEGERLLLAFDQAMARWAGLEAIKKWVLDNARNQVINTFEQLRAARYHQHLQYLQMLPCYTIYMKYNGAPPMPHHQLHALQSQIAHANVALKAGVDEDWRNSCMQYPRILDYYFRLVVISFPDPRDPALQEPRF